MIEYVENVTSNTVISDKYDSGNGGSPNYKFTANTGDVILIKVYQKYGPNAGSSSSHNNTFYFYLTGTSTPNAGGTLAESIQKSKGKNLSLEAVTDNGYTFLGWYDGDKLLSSDLNYSFAMGNGNENYTLKWIPCPLQIVSSNADGGSVYMPTTTIAGKDVTISAVTNAGYTFVGWYDGDNLLSRELQYTFTMPSQNVVYTAKWEVKEEFSNFNFVCTSDSITITGIKDNTVSEIIVPDNVTEISEGAFAGCSNLQKLVIPFVGKEAVPSDYNDYVYPLGYIFGRVSYDGAISIGQRDVSHNGTSLSMVNYYIPSTLKDIEVTQYNVNYYGFSGCAMLRSVILPSNITKIAQHVFDGCTGLTSITIPEYVISIESSAFYGCTGLTSIIIPENVISIGSSVFNRCTGLTNISIYDNISSLGSDVFTNTGFYNNEANWESGVLYIGNYLIATNNDIAGDYNIKNGTRLVASSAFRARTALTSISIPDTVIDLGSTTFYGCTNLNNVTFGNGLTEIKMHTFYNCSSLTEIIIPNGIIEIGNYAFAGSFNRTEN